MKLHILTVHDSKAEAFIQPFFSQTPATGIRMFEQAANDSNTDFSRHAEDYTLFELGTFDQDTAKFELHQTPISLGLAISYKTNQAPMPQTVITHESVEDGPTVTMIKEKRA